MPKWTEEQKKAIYTTGENIIVSAGAGSGKTAVLSERVLNHLMNGVDALDLLILTFTNAAAMEMKDRIRKKVLEHDALKDQADKIEVADITTFDAFALSLVKKYSYLLNVSSNLSVVDSGLILLKKREILENIFNEKYKTKDELFLKFINDFCLKDDKEIFDAILKIDDKLNNLYNKEEYLKDYVDTYYDDKVIDEFVIEYNKFLQRKIDEIKSQITYLESYVTYDYVEKLLDSLNLVLKASDYASIKLGLPDRLPILRGGSEEAKTIKNNINNIVKELKELTCYESMQSAKESIFSTKDYAMVICDIILKLSLGVKKFKDKYNAYEFNDIALMAIKIVNENSDVRLELKNKYYEILIDEYQDTNDIQEMFVSLISNNNVYMVGDVKQSIYRFRNANPLLFKEKYDNYSAHKGGMKIDLNNNFRSRKEVCDGINFIFNLVMDDEIGGANYFESHQMAYGNKTYENVNNEDYSMIVLNYNNGTDFSNEEVEIFTIARDIKMKVLNGYEIMDKDSGEKRSVSYNDFVILMDRSNNFETYKKVFEYLNIPLSIYRDKTISNSIDILLIRNLYRIIFGIKDGNYDVNFKHSFMSILRSYLYNMSDAEIFEIIAFNKYKNTDLYQKCFQVALEIDNLNNKDIYLKILELFGFYEKIITDGEVSEHIVTLDAILKIVCNLNDFGYSPRKFLEYLNEILEKGLDIKISLNKESNNSVKIMTIHSSKGLEWPICYFSGLYKKFNIDDLKDKFYFSLDYGFLIPYVSDGPKNTFLKTLLKDKYKKDEISERLRLFYVALTRAREKIIMVGSIEDMLTFKDNGVVDIAIRAKYNCFGDILRSIYRYLDCYVDFVDMDKLELTKDYNFQRNVGVYFDTSLEDKIDVLEYNDISEEVNLSGFSKNVNEVIDVKTKENIGLGLKMHKILEMIDFKNPDYSGLTSFEKNLVSKFLNEDIVKNGEEFYKEYEFIYEDNLDEKHGIIDLLIKTSDGYVIVDYKLNDITDKAYLKQLTGYGKYISEITDKSVEIYLYSIIGGNLIKLS